MSVSVALKRFINEYRDEIDNNEFDNLYAEWPGRTWELTFVLLQSGIDPLENLGWVPDYYANESTLIKDVKLNDDIVEVGEHAFTNVSIWNICLFQHQLRKLVLGVFMDVKNSKKLLTMEQLRN